MKADELLDSLEHIDPQLVHQADKPPQKAPRRRPLLSEGRVAGSVAGQDRRRCGGVPGKRLLRHRAHRGLHALRF